ncbi:cytochrome P450 [Diaporthe helianthi]|uniref:Cytochrome P450 n=1 Tax=Diaporthe helianthi TaxID=158607 RepID=A0A2P5I175_DIAHE|nr:cytochrome P450 [Diaporthe helianthi]
MSSAEGQLKLLSLGNILAGILASTALSLFLTWLRAPRYAKDIPRVGVGKSFIAAFSEMQGWIQDGYDKYSKDGKAFIIPGLLGTTPEVVLPTSQMNWMLDQPDHIISSAAAHYDILNGEYSFVDKRILEEPYQEHVVHRSLARHLAALIPGLDKQVRACVDDVYGTDDKEWRTVNIWDSLMALIPRVTNLMFVGQELCGNKEYIDNMLNFTEDVTRDLMTFPMVPTIIKPIVGPLAGLASKYHYRKTAKHSVPLIKQRLRDMAAKESGDPAYRDWKPPNDYITWTISVATAEGRTDELDPVRISQRLLPLNFAAIHTTAITMLHAFLDILAHDRDQHILDSLREEVVRVLEGEEPRGEWTKTKLSRLHRTDSAIRESMRVNAMAQTMLIRKVVAPSGVTNETTGQHFSRGTILSCPIWCTQHDEDIFGRGADSYDAFRYSRLREEYEAGGAAAAAASDLGDNKKDAEAGLRVAKMGMVTTSPENFGFGHGRHACPGRFFVAHELKMLVAYLLLNYDLKPLDERPPPSCIGRTMIPPTKSTMELKRKAGTCVTLSK